MYCVPRQLTACLAACALITGLGGAFKRPASAQDSAPAKATVVPASTTTPVPASPGLSDAERIARLERSLEADQQRLIESRSSLTNPDSEYADAEEVFKDLDGRLELLRNELQQAKASGDRETASRVQADFDQAEKKWSIAKQRFQLAIEERKAQQENIATLEQKVQNDRETLERLRGVTVQPLAIPPPPSMPLLVPPAQDTPATATPQNPPLAGTTVPGVASAPTGAAPREQPAATSSAAAPPVDSLVATPPGTPAASTPTAVAAPSMLMRGPFASLSHASLGKDASAPAGPVSKRPNKELAAATQVASETAAAADAAEQEANSISERVEILKQNIVTERKLRDLARKKVDNAEENLRTLTEELERKLADGARVDGLRQQVSDAMERLTLTRAESRRSATHLDNLQTELGKQQADQLTAVRAAQQKRDQANQARYRVDRLNNPFAWQNVLQWLLNHGVSVLVILLAVGAFVWFARLGEARLVKLMASRSRHGNQEERENRAKTLVGVFRNAANILTIGGGATMVLEELGLPVGPLLGGAAVIGLAVVFGAQSLIKDYFTGFMVLSEQQYMINDVIKVGDIAGQVERITLRMTVLRDLEGKVHFIPHGQINTVTNMTHGWSRAVFELRVAYKEEVDRVSQVILDLGRELRSDPQFGRLILEDLTMLGVDSLNESHIVLKFHIKTRPLQQWTVKREMLRRIKNRFDELSIEIPFPQRTIHYCDPRQATQLAPHHDSRWNTDEAA